MESKAAAVLLVLLVAAVAWGCGELDRAEPDPAQLAEDYKSELNGVDLQIDKLEVVLGKGTQRQRSLVIAFRTQAADNREAFNNEVLSLIRPAAGEKYGLADIMILATNQKGALSRTVSVEAEDVRAWAEDRISLDELVSRWIMTGF